MGVFLVGFHKLERFDSTERAAIGHGVGVCNGTLDITERAAIRALMHWDQKYPLGKCTFLEIEEGLLVVWGRKILVCHMRKQFC